MGFLSKLFGGGEPELPALDPASSGAQCISNFRPQFEALINKINDRYEAVPAQNSLYVFLGKPPGMFGIVWFLEGDDDEHNLKKMMAKRGLSQKKIDKIMEKLRTAYTEAADTPRYSTEVAGKKVIVTPLESLGNNLHNILQVVED